MMNSYNVSELVYIVSARNSIIAQAVPERCSDHMRNYSISLLKPCSTLTYRACSVSGCCRKPVLHWSWRYFTVSDPAEEARLQSATKEPLPPADHCRGFCCGCKWKGHLHIVIFLQLWAHGCTETDRDSHSNYHCQPFSSHQIHV